MLWVFSCIHGVPHGMRLCNAQAFLTALSAKPPGRTHDQGLCEKRQGLPKRLTAFAD